MHFVNIAVYIRMVQQPVTEAEDQIFHQDEKGQLPADSELAGEIFYLKGVGHVETS